jgi:hypothetical protein
MMTKTAISRQSIEEQFPNTLVRTSLVVHGDMALWLDKDGPNQRLALLALSNHPLLQQFHGQSSSFQSDYTLKYCPLDHANARALRTTLRWLQPRLLGLQTSAGFGDRLGLATPGHVQALRHVLQRAPERTMAPIFAQQSIREMGRTGRTPDDVMSDATWGAFQAGWCGGLGADADHLKTVSDIDVCVAAGFSFYTIDPGAYVDNHADSDDPATIQRKVAALPWSTLESSPADLERSYVGQTFSLADRTLHIDTAGVMRAAAKYGGAIAHITALYRHLAVKGVPFELEVSVDETETPTSHVEHVYIASELKRLGVRWVSLAPRYVGRFEKGVDYIGDLAALRDDLAGHAAIARALGPYKLSLHSGSDKFSVYPLIAAATEGMVHLKTAGTSYLEALRVAAQVNPVLFRAIGAFARKRYPVDRASYHVSAALERSPELADLADEQLPALLDQFDARQILHVTFGSTLAEFGTTLKTLLEEYAEAHYAALECHFVRHLEPFVR